jgi:PAS domain S-box-containing protein
MTSSRTFLFAHSSRLELLIVGIAVLAVTAASVFTYWNIVEDRDLTRENLVKVGDSLAATTEEHLNETLRDAYNAAYSAAVLVENANGFGGHDAAYWHRELNRELVDNTSVARLIAADASGRVIASSSDYPLPAISLAGSGEFRWQLEHPGASGMHLGVDAASPIDGRLVIPYSRAIRDARGSLIGVLEAELNVDYMIETYATLTRNFPAQIAVINRQGIRLAYFPGRRELIGRRVSDASSVEKAFEGNGNLEFRSEASGRDTLYSYRVLNPHLLLVGVGFDKEYAMAGWELRSRQRVAVVGAASVVFLALVGLFVVYLRKLQRSEVRLRASEAQMRAVADNLPNGMVYQIVREHDGTRRCIYASAGVKNLNGLSVSQMIGSSLLITSQIVGEDQVRLRAAQEVSLATMSVLDIVVRLRREDGELRWMQFCAAPRKLPDGRVLWDGIEIDVTDLKLAEDASRERGAKIESLFRGAPVGMGELVGRVFTLVNERLCQITGYAAGELIGKSTRILYVSEKDWEEAGARHYAQAAEQGFAAMETRFRRKDGTMVDVFISMSPLDQRDPYAGATVTAMDITESKAIRRKLEEAYDKLRVLSGMLINAQEAERRNISSELHDEIGQALTAVKMKLHHLGTRLANGTAAQGDVESCMEISDIALNQVRDLSVNLRPPQLDLMGLRAALEWLLKRERDPGVLLDVHFNAVLNAEGRTPQADITCFRVVQEALTNVLRHAHARNLWVDAVEDEQEIGLCVRDDGVGFDPETARMRATRGGSIGLLSMEERVTLQGGSFELVSRPGAGTVIRARIPLGSRAGRPQMAAGNAR